MQDILAILQHFVLPGLVFVAGLGVAAACALSAFVCHQAAETMDAE